MVQSVIEWCMHVYDVLEMYFKGRNRVWRYIYIGSDSDCGVLI